MSSDTPSHSKPPSMFTSDLFSTPSSSASNTSGLSTLGFGDDLFTSGSPFTLAPAVPVQSNTSSPITTVNSTPLKPSEKVINPTSSLFSSLPSNKELSSESKDPEVLSTVPLDSPPHNETKSVMESYLQPVSTGNNGIGPKPGSRQGWNDPPFISTYSSPGPQRSKTQPPTLSSSSSSPLPREDPVVGGSVSRSDPSLDINRSSFDQYRIQPLVTQTTRRSESPLPSSNVTTTSTNLPVAPVAPLPQPQPPTGGTNPYRLGGKRPTINMTPAYNQQPNVQPVSSSWQPPMNPPSFPPTHSGYPSGLPPPPTSSQVPPSFSHAPPTNVATVNPQISGNLGIQSSIAPVQPHWFYLRSNEKYWFPFSVLDSSKLEEGYLRHLADPNLHMIVQTDGGRYDIDISNRLRTAVYWEEPPSPVRRCTWFYKGDNDQWYVPYQEDLADKLEQTFSSAIVYGKWNSRVELPDGEAVIIHSPTSIVHYPSQHFQPLNHEIDYIPKSVLRGFLERDKVDLGEDRSVDHLVFIVHGIGPFADVRINSFRSLVDCVDDFREVAQLMLKTHKFNGRSVTNSRVEFLPVHWHAALHGDDTGVDEKVSSITPLSISRLRDFTNSTLIDILFYTSPLYLQTIVNQVSAEMNRMLEIFQKRNPGFAGGVSVMGHSLGSCILFDLLYHQQKEDVPPPTEVDPTHQFTPPKDLVSEETSFVEEEEEAVPQLEEVLSKLGLSSLIDTFLKEQVDFDSLLMCSNEDLKELGVPLGPRKKLNGFIIEWSQKKQKQEEKKARLKEERQKYEMEQQHKLEMETAEKLQGIEGVKFVKGVAGTGEPLVNYPQLNFNPASLFAVGSPIGLFLTVRGVETLDSDYQLPTCPSIYNIFHPYDPVAYRLEPLVVSPAPPRPVLMPHHKGRKRFHLELYENLEKVGASVRHHLVEGIRNMWNQLNEIARGHTTGVVEEQELAQVELSSQLSDDVPTDLQIPIGVLNGGDRIDYVLQEKPIEKLNEYIFSLSSHLCYWRSEDTALFILKQIYKENNTELNH